VKVILLKDVPGTGKTGTIAEALERKGFSVNRKQIELDEPIHVEGFYKVPIRLRAGVVVQIDLNVLGTS
jgi:ribosomal protein L9